MQPRVLISTDIGGNDKDDAQSMIHALLYADEVDYRGFVATSSDASGVDGITPMNKIIDVYAQDLPNLLQAGDYPDADAMRDLVVQGANTGDWPGKLSEGAALIIEEAKKASPDDPLYLLTWGPIHDVARALYEAPEIVENVRVYSVYGYGQDSDNPDAFNWMKEAIANDADYRELWWIDAAETFRGMYVGSEGQNDPGRNLDWVKNNVDGHGALGELFYHEYSFDLYGGNSPDGLKMGDTPSLLYLLDAVSNDDPTLSSWGGSFEKSGLGPNTWVDKSGEKLGQYDGAATVAEHRDDAWGDFADRLDIAKNGVEGGAVDPIEVPDTDEQGPEPVPTPTPDPEPEPSPTPDPEPVTDTETGSNGNDTMKGGQGVDVFDGGAGNDRLLGRGANDILDGGAGSDFVKAGEGDDTLIYTLADNAGAEDKYVGSRGADTLRLQLTQEEFARASVQDDIADFERFIAENAAPNVESGPTFSFESFDLTVKSIEALEVVVIDDTSGPVPVPSQSAPVAEDDAATTDQGRSITIDVLANDHDADGDTLSVVSVGQPSKGSASVNAAGQVIYDADETAEGMDTFSYIMTDGTDIVEGTVSVMVTSTDVVDLSGLPVFDDTGTNGNDRLAGRPSAESYNAAGGDDIILGRGGNDMLAGGAGDDFVKGGAGDDLLIYFADDNRDAQDIYQGSRGVDTLELHLSADLFDVAAVQEDVAAFREFAEDTRDTGRTGGESYTFSSFDLRVQSVENIEVYLYDLG